MKRRLLFVSQRSEFSRLLNDHRVGSDGFAFRLPQVLADLEDERGDVIQQAVRRKDVPRVDRKDVEEPLEPSRGQRAVLAPHAHGDGIAEIGRDHIFTRGKGEV
jgi:hypothetical protein